MKKRNLQRIFAAFMATAMAVTAAGCTKDSGDTGSTTTPEPTKADTSSNQGGSSTDKTTPEPTKEVKNIPADEFYCELNNEGIYVDQYGNKIDLGGMHIIVRDWWSSGRKTENLTAYDTAQYAYWDEIQAEYNFTIESQTIGDWGTVPQDFVDYASVPDDGNNYVFTLRDDPAVTSAMNNGLMYDLSTLYALDFSQPKFQANLLHQQYSKKGAIYCMFAGPSEPRTGVYFNMTVLKNAGIDPNEIYDLQKNDQWTWDKFDEYMGKVQRDTDSDGVDDIFGLTINEGVMTTAAIFSNGGSYIGKDDNGYYYNLESAETTEALNWAVDMYNKYDQHDPEGAQWDYYKEEFLSGCVGFMVDDEYCAMGANNFLAPMAGNIGFVMFPKGRSSSAKLVNVWSNNPVCIPSNYDKMKAGKLAFAWNLYTEDVPGFEDYNARIADAQLNGNFDDRAKNETIPMMVEAAHGTVAYHGLIPDLNLGPDFQWGIGPNADVAAAQEAIRDTWKSYVDAANK